MEIIDKAFIDGTYYFLAKENDRYFTFTSDNFHSSLDYKFARKVFDVMVHYNKNFAPKPKKKKFSTKYKQD